MVADPRVGARRIGLIVPSTNTVMERDFWRLAPDGVIVVTARMHYDRSFAPLDRLDAQLGYLPQALRDLASAGVDTVVYGCTSGSFFRGAAWEARHHAEMTALTDGPVVLTARAVVDAARALGLRRLTVLTPYQPAVNERLGAYLLECGFTVKSMLRPDVDPVTRPADVPVEAVVATLRSTQPDETDGYLLACTALPVLDAIEDLEAELGRPVISSNQAAMWAALRAVGHAAPVAGHGRLLARYLGRADDPVVPATHAPPPLTLVG
jgi:arylmalonate decarboxylase